MMQAAQNGRDRLPVSHGTLTAPAYGAHEPGMTIQDFLGILRRRRIVILATVCLITGLAALLAFQLTPRYTATADLLIKPPEFKVIDLQGAVSEPPPDPFAVETELDVMRSNFHAQRVIEALGLLSDPEFNPFINLEDTQPSRFAGIPEWLASHWLTTVSEASYLLPALLPSPAGRAGHNEHQGFPADEEADRNSDEHQRQMAATVRQLLQKLQIEQNAKSYVISINFTSPDPQKAARIANAVAQLYVSGQREEKLAATTDAAAWLTNRVKQLRQAVLESDRKIDEYRNAHQIVSSKLGSLGEQELANLNLEVVTARAERAEKEVRLQRAREVRSRRGSYESLAEVMSSPVVIGLRQQEAAVLQKEAQLSKEFGPLHPIMLEVAAEKENLASKIDLEVGNILANLENEVAVARSREQALAEALGEAKDRSAVTNRAEIELRQLERESEANRSLYESFLTRLKQLEEQLDLVRPDAKVVSLAAVPQNPSFPKPKAMIVIGFTSSVMLGVLMAMLRERLDTAFHTGRQLHEVLGVTSFGLVPAIRRGKGQPRPHRYLLEKPLSAYADAIRSVQKSVELSGPDGRSQIILVTSTLPGEGKTTLALSLAASAARSGRKTVVLDVDLRHPSVAREIGQPFGPGLVEFLTGEATADEIIHVAEFHGNLHFIPVRGLTSSPVDLLESREMATLLTALRTRYHYVFLDGPPALVTDARAAASLADTVLYAVRWNKTKAEVASHGLEALAGNRISVAGLVLTQVNLAQQARYGYGNVASYYGEYKKYCVD
jgi:polysaccharide biosynthesis transport protein